MENTNEPDIGHLIRQAGGPTSVARALGIGQSAVSNWISRGQIPLEHAAAVAELANIAPEVVRNDVTWVREAGVVVSYLVPVAMPAIVTPAGEPANACEVGEGAE